MRPGVRGDLVAIGMDATDDGGPFGRGVVDSSLTDVVARDEERGFGIVGTKQIEKLVGVQVGTIVESKGDGVVDGAGLDVNACLCQLHVSLRLSELTLGSVSAIVTRDVQRRLATRLLTTFLSAMPSTPVTFLLTRHRSFHCYTQSDTADSYNNPPPSHNTQPQSNTHQRDTHHHSPRHTSPSCSGHSPPAASPPTASSALSMSH